MYGQLQEKDVVVVVLRGGGGGELTLNKSFYQLFQLVTNWNR